MKGKLVKVALVALIIGGTSILFCCKANNSTYTTKDGTVMTNGAELGKECPNFELPDQNGQMFKLSEERGKPVVIFFYPKDGTTICTKEVCSFRDSHEKFKELGAIVVGISSDSVDSHVKFAKENSLGYRLLSDTGGKVRTLFHVPKTLGVAAGRVTYVIDDKGIVRHIYNSQLNADKHVTESLAIVEKIVNSNGK